MLNVSAINGRLTKDPELRSANGVDVASFTVAVDRNYTDKDGTRATDFIQVVAWRQTAQFVCRYFHKGSMIAVNGSLQSRSYEDGQGNKRSVLEIVADNVSFCGGKNDDNSAPQQSQPSGGISIPYEDTNSISYNDEELPF